MKSMGGDDTLPEVEEAPLIIDVDFTEVEEEPDILEIVMVQALNGQMRV